MVATRVPAFLVSVLQSASNMLEISSSLACLVVHPSTRRLCAARETHGGLVLTRGRDGEPVDAEVQYNI